MRRSYKIALASVSCAIAVIAVVAQAFVSTLSIALNVIAALAISLPLTQKSVGGAIFSYVAAGLIGFLAVNIKALPFIMFYAPYAIIAFALDFVFYPAEKIKLPKWVKIVIITVVKLGFFAAAFYGCIMLMKIVIADINIFGIKWTLPLLMLAGLVLFCVYDPLYRFVFVNMQRVVTRYVKGNRRNSGKADVQPLEKSDGSLSEYDGSDVFDGFGDNNKEKESSEKEQGKEKNAQSQSTDGEGEKTDGGDGKPDGR